MYKNAGYSLFFSIFSIAFSTPLSSRTKAYYLTMAHLSRRTPAEHIDHLEVFNAQLRVENSQLQDDKRKLQDEIRTLGEKIGGLVELATKF